MKNEITAHMMVKNEGRWCWFAIRSIIDYVDKIIIFDTGSNDKTIKCIEWFVNHNVYGSKIIFKKRTNVSTKNIKDIRQEMIDMTTTSWFLLLDGDEVWFKNGIEELINIINSKKVKMIGTKFTNCVGNVFQRQSYKRDNYSIKDEVGSITIRAYSKNIEGIHCSGDYGVEGFYCSEGREVQSYKEDIIIQKYGFLHTSYTMRASNFIGDLVIPYRLKKIASEYDYVVGKEIGDFPEVFYYIDVPNFVPNPFSKNRLYIILKYIPILMNKVRLKMKKINSY